MHLALTHTTVSHPKYRFASASLSSVALPWQTKVTAGSTFSTQFRKLAAPTLVLLGTLPSQTEDRVPGSAAGYRPKEFVDELVPGAQTPDVCPSIVTKVEKNSEVSYRVAIIQLDKPCSLLLFASSSPSGIWKRWTRSACSTRESPAVQTNVCQCSILFLL
jgi:hypothetical protein